MGTERDYEKQLERQGNYIDELEKELGEAKGNIYDINRSQRIYNNQDNNNLIVYQLSFQDELDNIFHLLRGDIKQEDKEGNLIYIECSDEDKPLNDFGVQRIMNKISFYLHKGMILGYYMEPKEFYPAILTLMEDISDYMADNFIKLGMDTDDKIKMYPFIVDAIKDNVVNVYRRNLFGRELNSLRQSRMVTQKEGENNGGNVQVTDNKKAWYKFW